MVIVWLVHEGGQVSGHCPKTRSQSIESVFTVCVLFVVACCRGQGGNRDL